FATRWNSEVASRSRRTSTVSRPVEGIDTSMMSRRPRLIILPPPSLLLRQRDNKVTARLIHRDIPRPELFVIHHPLPSTGSTASTGISGGNLATIPSTEGATPVIISWYRYSG